MHSPPFSAIQKGCLCNPTQHDALNMGNQRNYLRHSKNQGINQGKGHLEVHADVDLHLFVDGVVYLHPVLLQRRVAMGRNWYPSKLHLPIHLLRRESSELWLRRKLIDADSRRGVEFHGGRRCRRLTITGHLHERWRTTILLQGMFDTGAFQRLREQENNP